MEWFEFIVFPTFVSGCREGETGTGLLVEISLTGMAVGCSDQCMSTGRGSHQMVEMVQLDRYGRAEISQWLEQKVVWGSRYASGLWIVGMECSIVSI
ncbi:hypothetical protein TNCV_4519091 [Trichonephila clavipes]|nr:hypothetical protein TNCV_4519091 [Trichonephila clavipes]